MKGRPKTVRRISFMPTVSGFTPYGIRNKDKNNELVFLYYEEYEALRLNDYEKHTQAESALIMGVSRPTYTRIYISAREKIAQAFIEGRKIVVEGGKVELDENWYKCNDCKALSNIKKDEEKICGLCGSKKIESVILPLIKTQEE